ncbi:MAG: hypothetical protein HRT99_04065, partial [Mycoplasmatales bacterium]|nr:hypothetical protein [Mycoplasmatales bacterium]
MKKTKKIITGLGAISLSLIPILASVSMSTNTSKFDKKITKLSKNEKIIVKNNHVYKEIHSERRRISENNIDYYRKKIRNSKLSANVKKTLIKNIEKQIGINKLFFSNSIQNISPRSLRVNSKMLRYSDQSIYKTTDAMSKSIFEPIDKQISYTSSFNDFNQTGFNGYNPVFDKGARVTIGEDLDDKKVFGASNYIDGHPLVGPGNRKIKYKGIVLNKSGSDAIEEDYHTINPDITTINVSNATILVNIASVIKKIPEYKEFNIASKKVFDNLKITNLNDVFGMHTNSDFRAKLDHTTNLLNYLKEKGNKLLKSKKFIKMNKLLNKINYTLTAMNFINDFGDYVANEGSVGIIDGFNKAIIKTATPFLAGAAIGFAVGGPLGVVAGAAASFVFDALLNVIPTPNGYSISDNIGDHGLNDFNFQWKENEDVMTKLELEFSENLSHGISWKVDDSLLDTPNLWIRPGQIASEPWVNVSEVFGYKKTFVWGEPVRFKNYNGITSIRRNLEEQARLRKEENYRKMEVVYKDILEVTSSTTTALSLESGGVEYSDDNKNYDMTLRYRPYGKYNAVSMEPSANVHENDHDDEDDIKYRNWSPSFSSPIELKKEDIMNDNFGDFSIAFDDGNIKSFSSFQNELKMAAKEAIKYSDYVFKAGKFPHMYNDSNGKVYINDNYERFDIGSEYIANYFLNSVYIGETRFTTYNDWGW